MSRTMSGPMTTHVASRSRTLAFCLRIETVDGADLCLTSFHSTLSIDLGDGALDYVPGMNISEITQALGLAADHFEVSGPIGPVLTDDMVKGRRLSRARFRLFRVNYKSLSDGIIPILGGRLGEIRVKGREWTLEGLGHSSAFNQRIGRQMSPYCDATFGDVRCKYPLLPGAWTATAAVLQRGDWDAGVGSFVRPTVYNGYHYECSASGETGATEPTWPTTEGGTVADGTAEWTCVKAATIEATVASIASSGLALTLDPLAVAIVNDEFNGGRIQFTSGDLAGLPELEIFNTIASTRTLELYDALHEPPLVGDTLVIRRPCSYIRDVCRDTWRNTRNFRGEPDVRGTDKTYTFALPQS